MSGVKYTCEHLYYVPNPPSVGGANCEDCGEEAPCQWFEAIGVEDQQCLVHANVNIIIQTTDPVTGEVVSTDTVYLCQRHGKRIALEAARQPVPPEYLDPLLIQEEP